jgi:5-oxoprolinase (ATP-hydrolysing) subunit C
VSRRRCSRRATASASCRSGSESVLEVRSPGVLTTVQDGLGRPEAAALGVPRGGAADPTGLAVANLLLGNAPTDPGVEITLSGPDLVVRRTCVLALGGADLGATTDSGLALAPGRSYLLPEGAAVAFRGPTGGAGIRAYLALPGGVDVPVVLGSASTCLPGRFGGLDGRPLSAGDTIAGRREGLSRAGAAWPVPLYAPDPRQPARVRVTAGPDAAARSGLDELLDGEWSVSPTSSRAGVRLAGRSIGGGRGELISLPMWWGAVQLPPNGEPIILLVDAPTVGGYPVPAVVATVDRAVIGQLGPGDRLRFALVSEDEARAAELARRWGLADAAAKVGPNAWELLPDSAGAWPGGGER